MRLHFITKYFDYPYDNQGGGYSDPLLSSYQDPSLIDPQLQQQAQGSGILGSVGQYAGMGASLGSVVPGLGSLIGGVVGAGVGLISGVSQKNKAKSLLAKEQFPTYSIPREALANQQIAQQNALIGTPSAQYNQAMKDIKESTNQAISNAQSRNAGLGYIGAAQQNENNAVGKLGAQSVAQRLANEKVLMGANTAVAGYRDKQFQINQMQKYQQNYNYAMGLLGAGNQNIVHGVDALGAGLMRSGLFNKNNNTTAPKPLSFGSIDKSTPGYYGSDPLNETAPVDYTGDDYSLDK